MMKLILSLVFPTLSVFAALVPRAKQCEPAALAPPPPCIIDLQGQYQIEDACGITVSGSALYWKAYEEGLDYVIKNTGIPINNNGSVERPVFDWNWGYRIDLGYEIPKKKMDLNLCWTRYTTQGTVSDQVTSPTTLFSVWSIPNGAGNAYEYQSKAHTHLALNIIDLGMSATFAPRPFLDITPTVDLSALWIRQKFEFNLSGGPGMSGLFVVDDNITMKNDFFGLGPKLGIDTLWSLGWGFGIFGNFNLSLIYGFFDISQEETVTFTGTAPKTYLNLPNNSYHNPRINFDLILGMRWDRMFSHGKYHLLIEAGWENLIFMGQNQLMRFTNLTYPGINNLVKGDLAIQGLSLRSLFTF